MRRDITPEQKKTLMSNTHRRRRRDATKQFRRVGGVYWALSNRLNCLKLYASLRHTGACTPYKPLEQMLHHKIRGRGYQPSRGSRYKLSHKLGPIPTSPLLGGSWYNLGHNLYQLPRRLKNLPPNFQPLGRGS